MVDLHLHSTASDGLSSPRQLVQHVAAAGLAVMAVTDHDTTAAIDDVRLYAQASGIELVTGIEITAVDGGRDVHVLGYFFDPEAIALVRFLVGQRAARIARVEAIAERLAQLGVPIDVAPLIAQAQSAAGRSIGRPQVARAMVAAGHVGSTREAFDRWLGSGGPAFASRSGASPEEVIEAIHNAGGLASLAHPGRTAIDGRIPELRDAGLDALEAHHSDHDPEQVFRYRHLSRRLDMLVTGGSDFHGDPSHGVVPGAMLPSEEWRRLDAARTRHGGG